VFDIEVDHNDSQKLYIATENGFYYSIDGGDSWKLSNSGIKEPWLLSVEVDPANPKINLCWFVLGAVFLKQKVEESPGRQLIKD